MALTTTVTKAGVVGDMKYRIATVLWDSSYATAGEAFTPADVGLSTIFGCVTLGVSGTDKTAGVLVNFNSASSKLQAFGADGSLAAAGSLREVANTVDLSGTTSIVMFIGI